MKWSGRYNILVLLALLVPLLSLSTAQAGEGDVNLRELKPGELASPLEPVRKMLSGRNWLITSGLDPALGIGLGSRKEAPPSSGGGGPAAQAGGGGAALVPYRDPSAKFSRNILIPSDFSQFTFQTEPSLAIDPGDPDHILVGMIDYNFPNMVTYSSIDGGATWEGPHQAKYPRQDLGAAGDPIVAFDRKGNAYYAYISLDIEEFTIGPLLGSSLVSAITVSRSADGGLSWDNPTQATCPAAPALCNRVTSRALPSFDNRLRAEIDLGFVDKPWMTIGPHPDDPSKDVIYVAYTNFLQKVQVFWVDELPFLGAGQLETVIQLVRSEDGGVTWSKPIDISPRAQYTILFNQDSGGAITQEVVTQATSARQVVQGSDVAVAPDGTVYVSWLDTTQDDSFEGLAEIQVARSDDAGVTFERERRASGFLEPGFRARNVVFRSWASAFPKLGIGPNGEVYVLWVAIPSDNPEDDGDVFAVSSTDKGRTWSRRVRVNDDDTDHFQFFPELTVGPDGTLHAMWGDFRDDAFHVRYHIYYATSEDGGQTWSTNSRVTDFPTNPNKAFPSGRFIGDYFAIEATEDDVYMVWADGRLGQFGPTNQKIGFARKRLMPAPAIFISPPSGPGGKDVVVQGFNFQPNRDVFIEVAGVIVSTARTQAEGRFTTQIFIPIAGKGAHRVRVIEESGNVASSSFFMDFGFDTIQEATDKLDQIIQRLDSLEEVVVSSSGNSTGPVPGTPTTSVPSPSATPAPTATPTPTPEESSGFSCSAPSSQSGNSLAGLGDLSLLGVTLAALVVWRRRS